MPATERPGGSTAASAIEGVGPPRPGDTPPAASGGGGAERLVTDGSGVGPWLEVSPRLEDTADARVGAVPRGGGGGSGGVTPRTAFTLYAIVVLLFLAVAPFLQGRYGLAGLVVLQLTCILSPALVYVRLLKLPWRTALSLRMPPPAALAGAALLGASVWFLLVSTLLPLQNLFLPPSEEFLKQREMLFSVPQTLSGWLFLWGAAALTPAICEEILFRGVLLHSIRMRRSDWEAVLMVSLMFAVFHFNPYQLSITFVLGLLLGGLVVRTGSILSSMTFHLVNNTIVLVLAQESDTASVGWWALVLVLAAVLGGGLVQQSRQSG